MNNYIEGCCPKKSCKNHGNCAACIKKHKNTESLPYCLFPNNNGDKSLKHFYEVLKDRFENSVS